MVIAIDGPAGAGKSTVARGLAEALGITYLDSGAMYRCVALAVRRAGADPDDPYQAAGVASEIEIAFEDGRVTLDSEDVSDAIRTPEVSALASRVSVHPGVREAMVLRQRALISRGPYVAEGRDIGTVVSPDAPLKVFLIADDEERAKRRAAETGRPVSEVLSDMAERDRRDTEREHGALRAAESSVMVDTTGSTPDEVVERIAGIARERGLFTQGPSR
jgi:cytidylate kinase